VHREVGDALVNAREDGQQRRPYAEVRRHRQEQPDEKEAAEGKDDIANREELGIPPDPRRLTGEPLLRKALSALDCKLVRAPAKKQSHAQRQTDEDDDNKPSHRLPLQCVATIHPRAGCSRSICSGHGVKPTYRKFTNVCNT
jgi:hypothetical protein